MTYLIEVASISDSFWTLEKVRANSCDDAIIDLKRVYGNDALIGNIKVLW